MVVATIFFDAYFAKAFCCIVAKLGNMNNLLPMQIARIFIRGLSSEGPIRPIWDKILKSTINKKLKQPEGWQLNKRIPTRRVNCNVNSNQLWKNNSGSCGTSKLWGPKIRRFSYFRRLINQNLSKIGYSHYWTWIGNHLWPFQWCCLIWPWSVFSRSYGVSHETMGPFSPISKDRSCNLMIFLNSLEKTTIILYV